MQERHELIDKVQMLVQQEFKSILNDRAKYKELLKRLIMQGLIKLHENVVELLCLKQDVSMIEEILPEVQNAYKELMKKETGQESEVKVVINDHEYITEEK